MKLAGPLVRSWWYLRFMLPAMPILYFFGADFISSAATRFGAVIHAIPVAMFAGAINVHSIAFVRKRTCSASLRTNSGTSTSEGSRAITSNKSVIIAAQHGGSIRYYAGVEAVRYDVLPEDSLDQVVSVLRGFGYGPYLVLEDWEEPLFRDRFKSHETVKTLDSRVFAVLDTPTSVRIYDLSGDPLAPTPRPIRHLPRTECAGRYDDK